jgi:alkaline phosphatase D
MRRLTLSFLVLVLIVGSLQAADRIFVGSCLVQTRAHPALGVAVDRDPDLFLFLGDNVYADRERPSVIRRAYATLGQSPIFSALRSSVPVVATWDDHDYGANDAGRDFASREESEELFEAFWDVPRAVRERPGIYQAVEIESDGRVIKVIMLDTRFFRTSLTIARPRPSGKGPYAVDNGSGTILGAAQWSWLEDVLDEPADLRIVASSIQVLAEHHGWEGWANFPHEQDRLLSLLAQTGDPVLFVSGDRHFSEVSRQVVDHPDAQFAMTDITASSINRAYPVSDPTENKYRVGDYYLEPNVTELEIRWPSETLPPRITARVYDEAGSIRVTHEVSWEAGE